MVYFVTDGTHIKIGFTTRNINKRINELSTGASSPLYLLGYITNGDKDLEFQLHGKFKKVNLEWYEANDDLLRFINTTNDLDVYVAWLEDKLMVYKKMKK